MAKKTGKRWKRVLKRILTLLIVLAVLAGGGYYAWTQLRQEYTVSYDSYTAAIGTISNSLSFSGSLALVDSTTYSAQGSGTVRAVYVKEGDKVKKGDRLIRLSNGETYSADFDGTVNRVYVEKDDDVTMNTQLVQVADFTHMSISFRVDEYDISEVHVGQSCRVTTTAGEKTYESTVATIDYISSSPGNVAYYTACCYVDVDEGVYPGMQATVTIPQEEANDVVVLKMDALSFDNDNNAYVYVKNADGTMEQKNVTVGVSNGNYVEITSGVNDGDEVFAVAKTTTESSGLSALLSGTFGSTQINGGGMGGGSSERSWSRDSSSGSGSGFGGGNMPSGGSFPGGGN